MTVEKLDNLVVSQIADRLRQPGRLQDVLASGGDSRQDAPAADATNAPKLNQRTAAATSAPCPNATQTHAGKSNIMGLKSEPPKSQIAA